MTPEKLGAIAQSQSLRNPSWDEMTDAEKLTALRDAVVWMARDLNAANASLAALGSHRHAADGALLAPLHVGNPLANLAQGGGYNYAHNLRSKRDGSA